MLKMDDAKAAAMSAYIAECHKKFQHMKAMIELEKECLASMKLADFNISEAVAAQHKNVLLTKQAA